MWNIEVGDPKLGYAMTHAPLVVKDKVIVGVAGGEYGIRGFIAALRRAHRQRSLEVLHGRGARKIPRRQDLGRRFVEARRRAGVADGFLRSRLNLMYWGTGNPGPDWNGDDRAGDNLYSDCAVALDADTGKLKWYFQFTPHDEFDYDAVQIPVLVDTDWNGTPAQADDVGQSQRISFTCSIAQTGKFLAGQPVRESELGDGPG